MAAQQPTQSIIARTGAALLILIVLSHQAAARVFTFRASVPFQFVLGRETLPASSYIVEVLLGQSQQLNSTAVIVLKTPDGRVYRTAFTTVTDNRNRLSFPHSTLVFNRLRGKLYLTLVTVVNADVALGISSPASPDVTTHSHSTEVPMDSLR